RSSASGTTTCPDAIFCQTVLGVCDRWDHPKQALEVFERMRAEGLTEDPAVAENAYCCGIRAYERLGRWREAADLLKHWRGVVVSGRGGGFAGAE
ncbi:unnamed protein product, partial [Discosporangium mesarthrocarpum]